MNESLQSELSTGEFAELCHTTRETLYHYDEIGILKPERSEQNRYRRYRVRQFFDFDTIRVLQRAGTPLCEIRQYLEGRSTENCLRLMREKRRELQEQKEELERMIQMLSHTADMTEFALRQQYDKPQVICMEEQWLAAVALRTGEGDRVESVAKRLREHFAFCEANQIVDKFPLGSIIPMEHVLRGSDEESHFFSAVRKTDGGASLLCKPAGFYATLYHKGRYNTFQAGFRRLLCYIEEKKLTICGCAYVYDLISYLAAGTEDDCVLQISIQVEEAAEDQ